MNIERGGNRRATYLRKSHIDTLALLRRIDRYRLAGRIAFVSFSALLALFVKRPALDEYESAHPHEPKARHVISAPACAESDSGRCDLHVS